MSSTLGYQEQYRRTQVGGPPVIGAVLEWLSAAALTAAAYEWHGTALALVAAAVGLFYLAQVHDRPGNRPDGRQYAVTDSAGGVQGYVRLTPIQPTKQPREKKPGRVSRIISALEELATSSRAAVAEVRKK